MIRATILALGLSVLAVSMPVQAQNQAIPAPPRNQNLPASPRNENLSAPPQNQAALRCVLREIVSVLTCKPPAEIRLIGQRDEVYVFNTYYGSHFTEFYCQVFDKDVVVTSRSWKGNMGSARLNYEVQPGCITATVNSPWAECRMSQTVQCCSSQ